MEFEELVPIADDRWTTSGTSRKYMRITDPL